MSDDDRIEKLEREVQDLQDRLDNVTEERDELRAANETLTDKVSAAREEIEETLRGLDR
jgi:predicted  nucleic acid-binding Zn-ribbon protein